MTEQALDLLFIAVDVLRAMVICHFFIRFTGAPNKPFSYVLLGLVFLFTDLLALYTNMNTLLTYALLFVLMLLFCLLWLKRTALQSLAGALIVLVVTSVIGNILSSALLIATNFLPAREMAVINVASVAGSVIVLWALLHTIAKHFALTGKGRFPYLFTLLLPLAMIFIFSEAFAWATMGNVVTIDSEGFGHMQARLEISGWWGLLIFLFALGCMIVLFFAYQKFQSFYEKQQQAAQLQQAMEWQKTAIAEATIRYDATRAFRHDLSNHLLVLSGLLRNYQYSEAQAYLESISTFAAPLTAGALSGNPILNVLLNEKITIAKQMDIRTTCTADIGPTAIDDYDLCILVGNALDNAIKACESVAASERFINLEIARRKDFVYFSISNSKTDYVRKGQGYGLRNMQSVVQKYNGSLNVRTGHDTYEITAILSIPLQNRGVSLPND